LLSMITETKDLLSDNISRKWKIEQTEWEGWHKQIDLVELSPEVLNTIQIVKLRIDEYNAKPNNQNDPILIHDRRWKKIVRLLRTSAFLNGRNVVDLMDCFLMIHCLWHRPKQKEIITDLIKSVIRDHGYAIPVNLNNLKKEVRQFEQEVQNEIKVKHVSEEEEAMPVQENYFEFIKDSDEFAGTLIMGKDYHLLDATAFKVTNFFDQELNLVSRLNSKKGVAPHTLEIRHNTRVHNVRLKTKKELSTQYIIKKPHHLVETFWDKKYTQLDQFIKGHLHRIITEPPEQILHLHQNLFVPKPLAEIVKSNLNEVAEQLETLSIRLDKIKHSYAGIVE
ncbi:MAG: ATPase, partial [Bacteroidota bacterium]